MDSIHAIETAAQDVREARRQLDIAVAVAAENGHDWGAIGRAAGMTRQAARQRWTPEAREAILTEAQVPTVTVHYRDGRIVRVRTTDQEEINRLENLVFTNPGDVVLTQVDIPARPAAAEEDHD